MERARARVVVSGRVQGVFFRDSTRRQAESRGVTGWVRNLSDGRVEALFEGEASDVQWMLDWCRQGPPRARVDRVEVEWGTYTGEFHNFAVLPGWA